MELIGAGLGGCGDRRTTDLAVLGLVVRRDHLVLADGELREWIALSLVLAGNTATGDVALLAHTVDIQIAGTGVGSTAAQLGVAVLVDGEHHARHSVGELQEVARGLRQLLNLPQRNRITHFRGLDVTNHRCADGHRVQCGRIAGRRSRRLVTQIDGGTGGHRQGHRTADAVGFHLVGARLQTDDGVVAVRIDRRASHRAGGDIGDDDFAAALRGGDLAAQRGVAGLGHGRGGGKQRGGQGAAQQAARGQGGDGTVLLHDFPPPRGKARTSGVTGASRLVL